MSLRRRLFTRVSAVQHAFGEKATGGPSVDQPLTLGSSAGVRARTLSDPRVDVVRGRIGRTRALDDLDLVRKEVYPDKVALSVRVHDPPEIDRAHHDRVLDCTRGAVPKYDFDLGASSRKDRMNAGRKYAPRDA